MVLMLNPNVGLITLVSSPLIFSTIVVFPELSSPLQQQYIKHNATYLCISNICNVESDFWAYTISIRISFSFRLIFRMMLSSPIVTTVYTLPEIKGNDYIDCIWSCDACNSELICFWNIHSCFSASIHPQHIMGHIITYKHSSFVASHQINTHP